MVAVPVPVAPGTIQSISKQCRVQSLQIVVWPASPNPLGRRNCRRRDRVVVVVGTVDRGAVPTHPRFGVRVESGHRSRSWNAASVAVKTRSHTAIPPRDGGLPKIRANVPCRPIVVGVDWEEEAGGGGGPVVMMMMLMLMVVVILAVVARVWTAGVQNTVPDSDRVATIPLTMPKIAHTPGSDVDDVVAGPENGPRLGYWLLLLLLCEQQ